MIIKDTDNTKNFWKMRLVSSIDYHDIAQEIKWSLSPLDLAILADFHGKNILREKIENLLTDCNFHTEAAALSKGDYYMFPKVEFPKLKVKIGDTLQIVRMYNPDNDSYESNYAGKTGQVTHIDDIGQIHGTWGGCAIIPECDCFEIISK